MGADEIEFDIWPTKDGAIVSCHDATLERVSNGTGKIYEHTLDELLELDFGVKFGETFKELRIPTFEDILKKLGGQTIMNVHVKPLGEHYDPQIMKKIVDLVRKYDCARHVYFMIEKDDDVALFKSYAPEIAICLGHDWTRPWDLVDRAIKVGADKVQFFCEYINKEMIDKAHANGIICNYFYCDTVEKANYFLDMGIDTILTNDYQRIYNAVSDRLGKGAKIPSNNN
jgi:glycerophosphoryl diester phosphodiesterase